MPATRSRKHVLARRREIGYAKRMRTRNLMLEAARRIIAARGCDAPTIDDFINEAAVARGTFYNHFKDRVEVIEAVARQELSLLKSELASALKRATDPANRIAAIIRHCVHKAHDDPIWAGMMVHMVAAGPYLGNAMHEEFATDLSAGVKAGRFKFGSLIAALDLVKGATLFGMRSMAKGGNERELGDELTKLVLQGLGVPESQAITISSSYSANVEPVTPKGASARRRRER
jgi:AcrR family transcriptional regulator